MREIPMLIGAVPTADDLPEHPATLDVYLVRDTGLGWCWDVPYAPGEWTTQPWEPGCATYWCPADEVPDVP